MYLELVVIALGKQFPGRVNQTATLRAGGWALKN